MELKKLITQSLSDALKKMQIGETRIAPDDCTPAYVRRICSELKADGFLFQTSTRAEVQTVTRLK